MTVADQIVTAVHDLADRPGHYVRLADLRTALAHIGRGTLDQALMALYDAQTVSIEPQPFGHRIGPADKTAAIVIGGEDHHLIAVY